MQMLDGSLEARELKTGNLEWQSETAGEVLGAEETKELCAWLKEILGERINDVLSSNRLVDSPAMIVNADGYLTSSMERVLQASAQEEHLAMSGKKNLEINPKSSLVQKLPELRGSDPELAQDVAEQIFDNARIQAGLLVDSQKMVSRNYRILEKMTA